MIANGGEPCRISTYGDSFTHGDQVNDGETWQEQVAARLGEPVRNFGVGNYSVYQAYLRLRREEALHHARYLVFNMYDDDYRFDQPLVAFLESKRVPYVDMLLAHAADFARYKGSAEEYCARPLRRRPGAL